MTALTPTIVTEQAAYILAPNPGPMTLDGTNSYLLSAPGSSSSIVVDPGPVHDQRPDPRAEPRELDVAATPAEVLTVAEVGAT